MNYYGCTTSLNIYYGAAGKMYNSLFLLPLGSCRDEILWPVDDKPTNRSFNGVKDKQELKDTSHFIHSEHLGSASRI